MIIIFSDAFPCFYFVLFLNDVNLIENLMVKIWLIDECDLS